MDSMQLRKQTHTADETEDLASAIGRALCGGEVIELISDLGGGKTTFVRGLVRGAGSPDHVSSPTFTLCNLYTTSKTSMLAALYHFDFYRLGEAGIIEHELAETMKDKRAVVVIEWADTIKDVLPASRLKINISTLGENQRQFEFDCPTQLTYLLDYVDTNN